MNIFSAIIDSILGFIHRNPLTTVVLVMLMIFAPSVFGALFIGVVVLGLIILAVPLFMLFRLRRASRKFEKQAREESQQYSQHTYSRGSYSQSNHEGDVKVHSTSQQPQKRVSDNVGDYVDFEEVKESK